jgi:hypothetical protein
MKQQVAGWMRWLDERASAALERPAAAPIFDNSHQVY